MKIKTSELTGAALDWAVAKCEGIHESQLEIREFSILLYDGDLNYSTDWAQGGPIIEREEISIKFRRADLTWHWTAYKLGLPCEDNPEGGHTPLIAAMRCFIASRLGDEVELPEELK